MVPLSPTLTPSPFFAEQQQAPGKPFLRILSSGEPLGLAFANEADKNEVLEYMKQLKPAPAPGAPKETGPRAAGVPSDAQKRQIFAADKDLEALYGQLVTSGILSESDFWRTRQNAVKAITGAGASGPRQRSGLSSVMHEVEQLHDGQTERVNIHLTPQDIQRIFVERPEVHKAFLANVPHAMPETDFWKKYFKLEYKKAARRKRLAVAGRLDVSDDVLDEGDELFAPFRRQIAEQEAAANKSRMKSVDPTVNLVAEFGERWSTGDFGVGQSAANGEAAPSMAANAAARASGKPSGASAVESLARDLNRHSAQVLEGALDGLPEEGATGDTVAIAQKVAAAVQSHAKAHKTDTQKEVSKELLEEWQARAASALEDLTLENKTETVPLEVRDQRAYFGAVAGTAGAINKTVSSTAGKKNASAEEFSQALGGVDATALPNPPCDPNLAMIALMEVGRDADDVLVKQFGPLAAAAMGKHPKDALGSVMVVSTLELVIIRLPC